MKVSDYIIDFLYQKGIDVIFGYQGGMITHLVDSIELHPNMKFIQVYHEQTASIAVEGYAKVKNIPGVSISTSGPGVTNVITGIADAYYDSIPAIFITGQVNTNEYKFDKNIRQQGFQEMDVVRLVESISKYVVMISEPEDIRYEIEKAYYLSMEGRRGPVVLDIPMNVLRSEVITEHLRGYEPKVENLFLSNEQIIKIVDLIRKAKRPLVLIGGGAIEVQTIKFISDFLDLTQIPFVTSLLGKGGISEYHRSFIGMIGSYGNRSANMLVYEADLIVVLGSRLDTRQTGTQYERFLRNGQIIHVDIDLNELNEHRIVKNHLKVNTSIRIFIESLLPYLETYSSPKKWQDCVRLISKKYNQDNEVEMFVENKSPYKLLQKLNQYITRGDIISADVGQNQMWVAQTIKIPFDGRFLSSGGLAPMGCSIPMAIGAAFAITKRNIWAFVGDGGLHISLQSLMLISQYDLPVKVFVLNNKSLGMITQFQELYFNSRYVGTDYQGGYRVPDIKYIAEAYSLKYYRIEMNDLDNDNLMSIISNERNCIVEYVIDCKTKVSPKLEYNQIINSPSPMLSNEDVDFVNNLFNSTID